ncbi:hypothetical protein [Leucothrix arctica]|uniref:Methyltransferase domain-containing protein n=1 Tax=Leucothrix arctica TaxID=1481894 RepID=A0A317CHM9_9GAMM|nr:hypothetical protein [Leucothrix arctica]PWQ97879.1 hypothetical protein DKT75_05280 [Leucothrix arctica]
MTDIKNCDAAQQHFVESWDQQTRAIWPVTYPESLSHELKKLNVSTILDTCGGTGFPSIELKQMGWDITYSDGWDTMLGFFSKRLDETKLDIPMYLTRWENLSSNIPNTYDALLCAGNSFVGINTYDHNTPINANAARTNMVLAVKEFHQMLNTGGVLYIDLFKEKYAFPEQPYTRVITTDTHRIFTNVSYDPVRDTLASFTTRSSLLDGSETDTILKVTPMLAEDLIEVLLEAGFARVERSTVDDAEYVDSFFAFKD